MYEFALGEKIFLFQRPFVKLFFLALRCVVNYRGYKYSQFRPHNTHITWPPPPPLQQQLREGKKNNIIVVLQLAKWASHD